MIVNTSSVLSTGGTRLNKKIGGDPPLITYVLSHLAGPLVLVSMWVNVSYRPTDNPWLSAYLATFAGSTSFTATSAALL